MFTKLKKAAITFDMFVHMEQLSSHRMDFHQIWSVRIFLKSEKKIQVPSKFDKKNKYST
jgi:hypothetical protein